MSSKKRKHPVEPAPAGDKAIDAVFGGDDKQSTPPDGKGTEFGDQKNGTEVAIETVEDTPDIQAQIAELTDRNLRLQAEMENVRQRAAREVIEERRYAALPIVRDLLDVVDNIQRAIEAAASTPDTNSLLEGFQLVAQQLQTILAKHHCTPIEAYGIPFDPNVHEAIQQMPSDEQPAGNVMLVTQVGYMLHNRVVRPSQVIVSKGPSEASSPGSSDHA